MTARPAHQQYLICAAVLTAFAIVASSTAYAQGTPDGETPANQGVCDELIGATPGLYGLCVGFCEAQDCEVTLNEATGELSFDANCKPSSTKLLQNYNKRANDGDPTMPCVNVTEGECLCWSEAELDALDGTYRSSCLQLSASESTLLSTNGPDNTGSVLTANNGGLSCFFVILPVLGGDIFRSFNTTMEQFTTCKESIIAECEERGIPLELDPLP
jgi:hypothetical protein